jgi:carbon storage regulator CsrA
LSFFICLKHQRFLTIPNDWESLATSFICNQEAAIMLVLTRRISEQLVIGENVVITIVRVDGGQVRIGIEAPREISVRRAELTNKTQYHLPVIQNQIRLN